MVCTFRMSTEDPEYDDDLQRLAQDGGISAVCFPCLCCRKADRSGPVTVTGAEPAMFSDRQIAMLQTFADQAVIAIENTRLFNELADAQPRPHRVACAADRHQRDPACHLGSPTNTQPVFDAILNSATKLCEADTGILFRYDGERL